MYELEAIILPLFVALGVGLICCGWTDHRGPIAILIHGKFPS